MRESTRLRLSSVSLILGMMGMIWWQAEAITESYRFWRHGIQKTARVVEDRGPTGKRDKQIFHYTLEIDGERIYMSARHPLPTSWVNVLVMPDDPDQVMMGESNTPYLLLLTRSVGSLGVIIGSGFTLLFGLLIIGVLWHEARKARQLEGSLLTRIRSRWHLRRRR